MPLVTSPSRSAPALVRDDAGGQLHMSARILVVEHDGELARAVQVALRGVGHRVECVAGAPTVRQLFDDVDLVLFDVSTTGEGLELLRAARLRNVPHPPVLVISARQTDALRVLAMKAGADDYLIKPFAMSELQARVAALLRLREGSNELRAVLGDVAFDMPRRTLVIGRSRLALSRREASLLEILTNDFGTVVTKDQLMAHVFGDEGDVNPNTLEVFVHRVRRKLAGSRLALRTVHRKGYVLEFVETTPVC